MDFKKIVKDEKSWVAEKDIQNIPSIIKKEYELLQESVQKDDICGALFRLKDIYEICMKLPCILSIISISSYIENDYEFIRMSSEELKREYEEFLLDKRDTNVESEVLKKFGLVLSRLLKEPLSIGSWRELIEIIVEHSKIFEIDDNLYMILLKTMRLLSVRPKKVNGENGRYEDVSNWRNKTIGHGTLNINTEEYWEQANDLIKGLYEYFIGDGNDAPLTCFYSNISIERDEKNDEIGFLVVGEKRYQISEYIYIIDDEQYFFDSYYSRQNYTEITNYICAPKRLKNNSYYQTLYSLLSATKKGKTKKKGRQITNSTDREMYACLKSTPSYEKPTFVITEIKNFMSNHDKGILYIQMERGMGKSTLAHRLDGRYQKGILQKDLNALVRVYHISDMLLREENRSRDYFTSLNNNLISYEGGQLEIDNEEYYADGKDLRQLIEIEDENASLAFCQYLELFRLRYKDELEEDEELNLVYIIDGIDELNSDTSSILNTIPEDKLMQSLSDELVNHVYIILLSRTKEEDNLPQIAKECINNSEKKASSVLKIDSQNECYYQLLKKYLSRNYKNISDDKANEIIENAQRKFLYIQPYMAMGDAVVKSGIKISAYDVAENYINELQKLYCGTSLHTLQLIISSIAVFHAITLKEICNLLLFTEISYDVIGVLNDILPLLNIKRTDGEDTYSLANEEYEQFIYEKMYSSVCEVICRYRISLVSWFTNVDKKADTYGKQWGDYVRRALVVDGIAKQTCFSETTEEYVRSLIYLCYSNAPGTFYARVVEEELSCDTITQLRLLKYKKLELLSVEDLDKVKYLFRKCHISHESDRLAYEYTQEVINHCIEKGDIDEWFEVIIYHRIGLRHDLENSDNEQRIVAFIQIVEKWKNHNSIVNHIFNLVKKDMDDGIPISYGVYLEQLLQVVNDNLLRIKLYEGLLNAYSILADYILLLPGYKDIDDSRKKTIQCYLNEAEKYKNLENYDLIKKIKDVVFNENNYDDIIVQLEELADKVDFLDPKDYIQEFLHVRLKEKNLSDEQIQRYRRAQVKNYRKIMEHMRMIFDGQNADDIFPWLDNVCSVGNFYCFSEESGDLLISYLNMFDAVIKIYVEENNAKCIDDLARGFWGLLQYYDENVRTNSTGLYDENQTMTTWEKTYALYCSSLSYDYRSVKNNIPIVANVLTYKYLQELYENEEFEQYYKLNSMITEGYEAVDFRNNYILNAQHLWFELIRDYYRWITIRYFRSLDGKDELSSDELFNWLIKEYDDLFAHVSEMLNNESDLIHKANMLSVVNLLTKELLCLAKMVPDSISSVVETKVKISAELDELVKKATDKSEIKKIVEKITETLNNPSAWFNKDIEFVANTADKTIFGRY